MIVLISRIWQLNYLKTLVGTCSSIHLIVQTTTFLPNRIHVSRIHYQAVRQCQELGSDARRWSVLVLNKMFIANEKCLKILDQLLDRIPVAQKGSFLLILFYVYRSEYWSYRILKQYSSCKQASNPKTLFPKMEPPVNFKRTDEVIITRVRVEYSYPTQSLSSSPKSRPHTMWHILNQPSIDHNVTECPNYNDAQRIFTNSTPL